MGFDRDRIEKIKYCIEQNSIHSIIKYAQITYPNECCGFILENGSIHPAQNVVHNLYNMTLTAKNAFLIDANSWSLASNRESPIVGIYHSHTNGIADMSTADQAFLQWQQYCYLIIALTDTNPVASKIFWWEKNELRELQVNM